MAGVSTSMQIRPVDNENNLFLVENIMPPELVRKVLATDWLGLPWARQEGQENWKRRRIDNSAIPWIKEWDDYASKIWPDIALHIGRELEGYQGTAFWVDEPGFTCSMHTDGELPGSMHLTWFGARHTHGTAFYWYKDPDKLRYQFPMIPNNGYIMINKPDEIGYRQLLWHAMLTEVPENSFRLTSYMWMNSR